jgi:hypothetical protein
LIEYFHHGGHGDHGDDFAWLPIAETYRLNQSVLFFYKKTFLGFKLTAL